MQKRQFDVAFKQMAIELSERKGNVKAAAEELGIGADLLSKWRSRLHRQGSISQKPEQLSEEQKELRLLQKQYKELEEEHAILKKAVSIFSRDGSNAMVSSKNTKTNLLR